jgi:hypothetical protein
MIPPFVTIGGLLSLQTVLFSLSQEYEDRPPLALRLLLRLQLQTQLRILQ